MPRALNRPWAAARTVAAASGVVISSAAGRGGGGGFSPPTSTCSSANSGRCAPTWEKQVLSARQGVQARRKALRIRYMNGMEVRKKSRPRGFKKRPRGFK
jgi:hypothetical protein